ncbi:MAG: hypothetical protein HY270_06115 [Deltaproteobacteria bacterium]|nr:hypothetical protein [Deltaproteobacteria bacterium]
MAKRQKSLPRSPRDQGPDWAAYKRAQRAALVGELAKVLGSKRLATQAVKEQRRLEKQRERFFCGLPYAMRMKDGRLRIGRRTFTSFAEIEQQLGLVRAEGVRFCPHCTYWRAILALRVGALGGPITLLNETELEAYAWFVWNFVAVGLVIQRFRQRDLEKLRRTVQQMMIKGTQTPLAYLQSFCSLAVLMSLVDPSRLSEEQMSDVDFITDVATAVNRHVDTANRDPRRFCHNLGVWARDYFGRSVNGAYQVSMTDYRESLSALSISLEEFQKLAGITNVHPPEGCSEGFESFSEVSPLPTPIDGQGTVAFEPFMPTANDGGRRGRKGSGSR